MSNQLNVDGMSLAPGVVETIISIAANEVDGIASVGSYATSGLRSMLASRPSTSGIETSVDDEGKLAVTLHVEVRYGHVLPDLAARLREAVADALRVQVGVEVASVDVFVDGIQFDQQ
ncbi:Asp23/Gls24 family envelope stress response protein [Adlercreutzia sp. ZJ473]|uniref:Asp23/Gls24 family envelope stress response protein n=1 Tax=Adlercreutzia sp. ZJ473 TaxID=2722822 RepID=UPI001552CCCE|nr:Asp23/Gls24 family envelope stress response protein [Adlercreutzia sp. ZJ473]